MFEDKLYENVGANPCVRPNEIIKNPLHKLFTLTIWFFYKKEYITADCFIISHFYIPLSTLLRSLITFMLICMSTGVFAATKITPTIPVSSGSESSSGVNIVPSSSGALITETGSTQTNTGTVTSTGTVVTNSGAKQETEEEKKDKEKTINDINTFLIESYKMKIDRILLNLNLSLERVTNNDPIAQAKLLDKIRVDINTKIQVINSRNLSENRKKILSSVFSYIQENLEAKISKLVQQK